MKTSVERSTKMLRKLMGTLLLLAMMILLNPFNLAFVKADTTPLDITVRFTDEWGNILEERTDYHMGDSVSLPVNPIIKKKECKCDLNYWTLLGAEDIDIEGVFADYLTLSTAASIPPMQAYDDVFNSALASGIVTYVAICDTTPITYQYEWYMDDGISPFAGPMTGYYGIGGNAAISPPSKEGYSFDSWETIISENDAYDSWFTNGADLSSPVIVQYKAKFTPLAPVTPLITPTITPIITPEVTPDVTPVVTPEVTPLPSISPDLTPIPSVSPLVTPTKEADHPNPSNRMDEDNEDYDPQTPDEPEVSDTPTIPYIPKDPINALPEPSGKPLEDNRPRPSNYASPELATNISSNITQDAGIVTMAEPIIPKLEPNVFEEDKKDKVKFIFVLAIFFPVLWILHHSRRFHGIIEAPDGMKVKYKHINPEDLSPSWQEILSSYNSLEEIKPQILSCGERTIFPIGTMMQIRYDDELGNHVIKLPVSEYILFKILEKKSGIVEINIRNVDSIFLRMNLSTNP